MNLSKGVRALLVTFIDKSITVASWGVTDVQIMNNRLTFKVDGLLYKGKIEIIECGSVFTVRMPDGEFLCEIKDLVVTGG